MWVTSGALWRFGAERQESRDKGEAGLRAEPATASADHVGNERSSLAVWSEATGRNELPGSTEESCSRPAKWWAGRSSGYPSAQCPLPLWFYRYGRRAALSG